MSKSKQITITVQGTKIGILPRPEGDYISLTDMVRNFDGAGALIEQCGLKNAAVGKARISDRHANFIVTEPGATSTDVEQLIARVQSAVAAKFSVDLELEIQVW